MLKELKLFRIFLKLHEGEGGGEVAGETTAETSVEESQEGTEDRAKQFQDMIRGDFKEEYKKATQAMIDKRFAKAKEAEARLAEQQELIDLLHERNGTKTIGELYSKIENDDRYLEEIAEEKGMTLEQAREFERLRRDNERFQRQQQIAQEQRQQQAQINKWLQEAEELKQVYPDFDLETELQSDVFSTLVKSGFTLRNAFESTHAQEIMQASTEYATREATRAVTENIRARGQRPLENGVKSKAAFKTSVDFSKMSLKDYEEYGRRARNGERITFR